MFSCSNQFTKPKTQQTQRNARLRNAVLKLPSKQIDTRNLAPSCPNVTLYGTPITYYYSVVLQVILQSLDQRLTWAAHVKPKGRLRMLKTLLCNNKYSSVYV